jgi:hypothetical protein
MNQHTKHEEPNMPEISIIAGNLNPGVRKQETQQAGFLML